RSGDHVYWTHDTTPSFAARCPKKRNPARSNALRATLSIFRALFKQETSMKTFSRVAIATLTMVGMSGIALADTPAAKADPNAPPAKADPQAPGPGSGSAAAPAMTPPKPAPEIADTLKQMQGTWTCTGTAMGGQDMKTEMKFKATMTSKSDLDGFWI